MNSMASRLKAIAITTGFFAISAMALLGLIWGLSAIPFGFPGQEALQTYRPHDSVAAVSDLRLIAALSSAFLVACALILILDSSYCDRMLAVFGDVLLMFMAGMAGFIAGYWLLLRLAGFENFMTWPFVQTALVCPVIVFVVSLLPLARLRHSIFMRAALVVALFLAAPALLLLVP